MHEHVSLHAHWVSHVKTRRNHTHGSCDMDKREADRGMNSRERYQGCVDPGQLTTVGHSMHKCLRNGQYRPPTQV